MQQRGGASAEGGSPPTVSRIEAALSAYRARARLLIIAQKTLLLLAGLLGGLLFIALLDFLLRTPSWLRTALWLGMAFAAGWGFWRWVLPALHFRPSLTDIALRLEASGPAHDAGLQGLLAAGVELAAPDNHPQDAPGPALRQAAATEAARRFDEFARSRAPSMLSAGRLREALVVAGGVCVPILALTLVAPNLVAIGAVRVLAPWVDSPWPKRTLVENATASRPQPLGANIAFRALITKSERKADVLLRSRLILNGTPGPTRADLLTSQGKQVTPAENIADAPKRGELFERLLAPETAGIHLTRDDTLEIEYWFEAGDNRTRPEKIRLVDPPRILSASVNITPPEYAAPILASLSESDRFAAGPRELGDGRESDAVVARVLHGSRIELTLKLNKPLPAREATEAIPGMTFGTDGSAILTGEEWKITWSLAEPARLTPSLVDEFGIADPDPSVFRFEALPDAPPSSAIILPARDESVLAQAMVAVTAEARDDLRIATLTLMQQRHSPASPGGQTEPEHDAVTIASAKLQAGARQDRLDHALDLSKLPLRPGDEVVLHAITTDTFALDAAIHEPVRSTPRRLRIISESELVEQIRAELSGVRQAAMRLDGEQQNVMNAVAQRGASEESQRAQRGVNQRMSPLSQQLQRLGSRAESNRLGDPTLSELLQDAQKAVENASKAGDQAADALDRAAAEEQPDPAQRETFDRSAQEVRDSLAEVVNMLDRGQDGWAVRRSIERLAAEQRALTERTRATGEETRGRNAQDLTSPQREELEQLGSQQQELARRTQQAVQELDQRSQEISRNDPGQAEAMQRAAEQARRSRVSDTQQQAAEQTRQNQTQSANELQEQAARALEQMLAELDRTQQRRDETLRRVLADLVRAIEALIVQQEQELALLARSNDTADYAGLDAGMIALNRNTLAAVDSARAGGRPTAAAADHLETASRAQGAAVRALRATSPDSGEAYQQERLSLQRLKDAAEAARLQQENQQDRAARQKRGELKDAYTKALTEQKAMSGETAVFVGKELDRRDRSSVRKLADRQETLRSDLASLREQNSELTDSPVFDFAHSRLDHAGGEAAGALRDSRLTDDLKRDQRTVERVLASLIESLNNPEETENPFRESPGAQQNGGAGGGQNGGNAQVLPDMAQLRLLRIMQEEALERTREAQGATQIDDLAKLQQELADRAKRLLEKVNQPPKAPPGAAPPSGPPNMPLGWGGWGVPNAGRESERRLHQPERPTSPQPGPEELPSLDELLGLSGGASGDTSRAELDRQLSPKEMGDAFEQAVDLMSHTADRLVRNGDTGLATQRLQEDILRKLDSIIASAQRQQQQQQQQQSSSQSQSQPNQPQAQGQQSADGQQDGNQNDGQAQAGPERQDPRPNPNAATAGAAQWGHLPPHIRDAIRQGSTDRFSTLYRRLTEEYYRRLAEQPKP